jgi:3-dehydroquinate synthase
MSEYTINTSIPINYKITVCKNIFNFDNLNLLYSNSDVSSNKRLIVVDRNIHRLYRDQIEKYFKHQNCFHKIIVMDSEEIYKTDDKLMELLAEIENFNLNRRNEPIICIGGGVILDIVGLASSMYRRGVPYIRVPTTLLGLVDVSVAAKTAVNFKSRRNRLGSYYPPILSLIDKSFIYTQKINDISSGMGEILKMAVIKNYELFVILEKYGSDLLLNKFKHEFADQTIDLSIKGMVEELENNLWETDLKRLVDFGHTFSPIIEMRSLGTDCELKHGQAVALDVIFSSIISYNRNHLSYESLIRIINTAKNIGLPIKHDYFFNLAFLIESLNDAMKHRNGSQNIPIPLEIGEGDFLNDLTELEIINAIKFLKLYD